MLTKTGEGQGYLRKPENTWRNGKGPKAASFSGHCLRAVRKGFSGIPKTITQISSSLVLRNLINDTKTQYMRLFLKGRE